MVDYYQVGQTLTIILVTVSLMYVAINTLSANEVEDGLIGNNNTYERLSNDFNITSGNFKQLRDSLDPSNITIASGLLIPFEAINAGVDGGFLALKLAFALLTGWTDVIRGIFNPFGLCGADGLCSFTTLGGVVIGVFGAIQVYFLFRLVIIIASVIRGGGGA